MIRPGPRNLITDVDGVLVGNADDAVLRSGVTVIVPERPCVASVDVRGGAPGTRETDLLDPMMLVDRVDAICLSGGSAFGLSAPDGVMRWLRERSRGISVGGAVVPVVPGAILFDLLNGGDKNWDWPPYRELGYAACAAADKEFRLGNAGAGLGARAGDIKGGLGSASAIDDSTGFQVGAVVAVNSIGFVTMGDGPHFWAWALERDREFGGLPPPASGVELRVSHQRNAGRNPAAASPRGNTTIACVATNATLDKGWCKRFAVMAHDGLARAIRPSHTPQDGDAVFALATGRASGPSSPVALSELGTLAADCLARAAARAVYAAESLGAMTSWRERFGK